MTWEPHLKPGERLLWSGRPRGGFFSGDLSHDGLLLFAIPSVLLFLLIALDMFVRAGMAWGALLLLPLIWFGWLLWLDHGDRATALYAVTDQRVLVARDGLSKPVAWFFRSAREIILAQRHILYFCDHQPSAALVMPGSFQHRFYSGNLFFARAQAGKLSAVTLLDLEDAFEVLKHIRTPGEPDRDGSETRRGSRRTRRGLPGLTAHDHAEPWTPPP